jgi:hypothetical protein
MCHMSVDALPSCLLFVTPTVLQGGTQNEPVFDLLIKSSFQLQY